MLVLSLLLGIFLQLPIEDTLAARKAVYRNHLATTADGILAVITLTDPRRQTAPKHPFRSSLALNGINASLLGSEIHIVQTDTGTAHTILNKGNNWAPVWSPDGAWLAFLSDRDGGIPGAWLWRREDGATKRLPVSRTAGIFGFEGPVWMPDSQSLLIKAWPRDLPFYEAPHQKSGDNPVDRFGNLPSATFGSGEQSSVPSLWEWHVGEILRVPIDDTKNVVLISGGKPRAWASSRDGQIIAVTSFAGTRPNTQQSQFSLTFVNASDGSPISTIQDIPMSYGTEWSWSPHDGTIALVTGGSESRGQLFLYKPGQMEAEEPVSGDQVVSAEELTPLWHPQKPIIFLNSQGKLHQYHQDTGELHGVEIPDNVVLSDVVKGLLPSLAFIDESGNALVRGMTMDSGKRGFWLLNPKLKSIKLLWQDDVMLGGGYWQAGVPGTSSILFSSETASSPLDVWMLDTNMSSIWRLTEFNPVFSKAKLGKAQTMLFRDLDGREHKAALLLPPDHREGEALPLVMWVYGGSRLSYAMNGFGFMAHSSHNFHLLASRGYAVLLPDMPIGKTRPMRDIVSAGLGAVLAAVSQGIADPDRIGIIGQSFGGYSVFALAAGSEIFSAGIAVSPIESLFSAHGAMGSGGRSFGIGWAEQGQANMHATPWEQPFKYLQNSPYFFFDHVKTPTLIINGGKDETTPPFMGQAAYLSLKRLEQETAYINYKLENHAPNFWRFENKVDYWRQIIRWFDKYLND